MESNTIPFHIIKDPVHGSMQFTDDENNWIKPFIDSPNFQRLRHIKQLGLGDLVFPGAVHTRFNHALGSCYVAGQIATKLELSSREKRVVMIAGLLHDIGHGPFSHAFEGIFYRRSIHHEDWTPLFLKEYLSEKFVAAFNQRNPNQPINLEELKLINNLIMHKEKKEKLLADIVSSQLDADRLDYLRRDSHFCGVTYGDYDFRWLIHCLTIVESENKELRLGIARKGVGSVEQYLMARRLMMQNVYHNGKKYAAEFLLKCFLKKLAHSIWEDNLFKEVKSTNLAKFLHYVAKFNREAKENGCKASLRKDFLLEHYSVYKKLCDYDIFTMLRYFAGLKKEHAVVNIAKRLYSRRLPKVIQVDESNLSRAQQIMRKLKKKHSLNSWQIDMIALPHQAYLGSQDPILVVDKQRRVRKLDEDSILISGLSDISENAYLMFVDQDLLPLPELDCL